MSKVIRLSDNQIRLIEEYRQYKLTILKILIDDGFSCCCVDYDRIENIDYNEILDDIILESIIALKEDLKNMESE